MELYKCILIWYNKFNITTTSSFYWNSNEASVENFKYHLNMKQNNEKGITKRENAVCCFKKRYFYSPCFPKLVMYPVPQVWYPVVDLQVAVKMYEYVEVVVETVVAVPAKIDQYQNV